MVIRHEALAWRFCVSFRCSPHQQLGMAEPRGAWHDAYIPTRLEALALLQTLNAELLSGDQRDPHPPIAGAPSLLTCARLARTRHRRARQPVPGWEAGRPFEAASGFSGVWVPGRAACPLFAACWACKVRASTFGCRRRRTGFTCRFPRLTLSDMNRTLETTDTLLSAVVWVKPSRCFRRRTCCRRSSCGRRCRVAGGDGAPRANDTNAPPSRGKGWRCAADFCPQAMVAAADRACAEALARRPLSHSAR